MAHSVTTTFNTPAPEDCPLTLTELIALLNTLVDSEITGSFITYITGAATPDPEDNDKIWHRIDASGRPIGTYKFYSGTWRKQYSGLIGEVTMYAGDPGVDFDGGAGLGTVGGEWDGWALCLTGDSDVELEDGSLKSIREIVDGKLPVRVRCYNEAEKKFVTAPVVNWFKNEFKPDEFVRIRFNKGLQDSGKRSVTATKDHPFLTEMGWQDAGNLTTGDKVYGYEKTLTCFGKEALLGMWLGDGSYSFKDGRFSISHGGPQRDYIEYIADQWGVTVKESTGRLGAYNTGKPALRARIGIKHLFPEFTKLVPRRTPHITRELLNELSLVSLAFWYMDDGSLQKDKRYPDYQRACFHTQGFSDDERTLLAEHLKLAWGLTGTYYHSNKLFHPEHKFLRLDARSSEKFFALVSHYIHPSLHYKLPERFQSVPCALKEHQMTERNLVLREVQVREFSSLHSSETRRTDKSARYDIRVEGHHNFVANGFVVHNCNGDNGTSDLSDKFIVGAKMSDLGVGYPSGGPWKTTVSGTSTQTDDGAGVHEITLNEDNTYRPARDVVRVGQWEADGNTQTPGAGLYGIGTTATLIPADAGNTTPPAIPTLPPYFALAYAQFIGYA